MGYVPKPEISLTIDSKLWILYRIMKKSKFLPLPICLEKTPKLHHWWVTFSQLHITVDSGTRTSLSRKIVFFSLKKNNSSWKSSLLYVVGCLVLRNFKFFFFLLKLSTVCTFWIVLMCWCQKWFLKNEKTSHVFRYEKLFEKQPLPHCQTLFRTGYVIVWVTTFWPYWKKKKIQLRDNCRRFKLVFPYYSPWNYKGGDGFVFGKAVNIIFLNVFYLKNILK
jgi:hypothetical protein